MGDLENFQTPMRIATDQLNEFFCSLRESGFGRWDALYFLAVVFAEQNKRD